MVDEALEILTRHEPKEVKCANKSCSSGRVIVSKDLIGEEVFVYTVEEVGVIADVLRRLSVIKKFVEHVFNSKNGSRMFSIVSKTWNPVTGCTHFCYYCWARRLAMTKLRHTKRYRDGFLPKIHEEEFKKKFNGGVVFVSDMGDLFSAGVPDEWIMRVIEHVRKFPNTYFLFLTKNPQRYHDFIKYFPENAILGATIETDRDDIYIEHRPRISQAPLPSLR